MKNQNAAKVAINIMATGTTTASIMVLMFEDVLPLVEALEGVAALFVAEVRDFEASEDDSAAETSEL